MDAVTIPKHEFKALVNSVQLILSKLDAKKERTEPIIDNQEFMMLMKVSKRTAQSWRDQGLISYSMVGSKIYYKQKDIDELINSNYIKTKRLLEK
jgi:hypothetical protein